MTLKKSIAFVTTLSLFFTMFSCDEDNSLDNQANNFVGLEISKIVEISDGETVTVEGRILASNSTGQDRTFNLVVESSTTHGAGNYSVPTSVTIPAGSKEGTYEVTIIGNNLVDGNKVVVRLEPTDETNVVTSYTTLTSSAISGPMVYSSTSFILYKPCASVRARLSIKFDNYPEETAWELYDADFNLIDSGGLDPTGSFITGYAALGFADRSTFSVVKCLAPGTYTFVIYDDYGDGMYTSSTVSGTYSMNNLNNGASLFSGGGDFGAFAEHEFVIQ